MSAVFVYVTVPTEELAVSLARTLVAEGLCACANILPGMRSVYRWDGAVEEATEVVAIFKTTAARFDAIEARLRALHPYQCPCIVALPVSAGNAAYLDWIAAGAASRG